jgi:hypothetical protein
MCQLPGLRSLFPYLKSLAITAVLWMVAGPSALAAQRSELAVETPTRYFSTHFSWHDVDVERLRRRLATFGVHVPLDVAGLVTVDIRADIPINHLFTANAYRLHGVLSSARLVVNGVELKELAATLDYDQGVLRLSQLLFQLPNASGPAGSIAGSASMQLVPRGDLTAQVSVDRVGVARLLEAVPELHASATGLLSGAIRSQVPVDRLRELSAWQAQGQVNLSGFRAMQLPALDATSHFRLANGLLTVDQLDATTTLGRLVGAGDLKLSEPFPFTAQLNAVSQDLSRFDLLPASFSFPAKMTGNVSLEATAQGTLQPLDASAQGTIAAGPLAISGVSVEAIRFEFDANRERMNFNDLVVRLHGGEIQGAGNIQLTSPFPLQGTFTWRQIELGALASHFGAGVPPMTGRSQGLAVIHLSLATARHWATWSIHGTATLEQLVAGPMGVASARTDFSLEQSAARGSLNAQRLQIDDAKIDALAARFAWDGRRLALDDMRANLYDGMATGAASLPFDNGAPTSMALRWQDVDAGRLLRQLLRLPFPIAGRASGDFTMTAPPGQLSNWRAWTVRVAFASPEVRVRGMPIGELSGSASYQSPMLRYALRGTLAGGRLDTAGLWPVAPNGGGEPVSGKLDLRGVRLARLAEVAAGNRWSLAELSGIADLDLHYEYPPEGNPTGSGVLVVSNARWGGLLLSDRLQAVVRLIDHRLELDQFGGMFARGRITGAGAIDLDQPLSSTFRMSAVGIDLSIALEPWPSVASMIQGLVDLDFEAYPGNPWQASGAVSLRAAKIGGVAISGWRLPISAHFSPASWRGEFEIRDARAQFAGGNITGKLRATWNEGLGLQSDINFSRVDVRKLLQQGGSVGRLASGKLDGALALSGRNVRSLGDLQGSMRAKLRDAQALAFPFLDSLQPFLLGIPISTVFTEGDARARLARGVVHLERLALSSSSAQLFAFGRVTIAGRLDLNVTATNSPTALHGRLGQILLARFPLVGPAPIAWLVEANRFLANRVIYLHVSGDWRHPTIQLLPVPMLEEEAARFFLSRAATSVP